MQVAALSEFVARSGFKSITVHKMDANKCMQPSKGSDGPLLEAASFDKVLLDAPCSGLGMH